jgi:hypothetical protein
MICPVKYKLRTKTLKMKIILVKNHKTLKSYYVLFKLILLIYKQLKEINTRTTQYALVNTQS